MQREIEARGIPTVLVTVVPEETRLMRPPRALHPHGHGLGKVMGTAGDVVRQRLVLLEALLLLERLTPPGSITHWHAK